MVLTNFVPRHYLRLHDGSTTTIILNGIEPGIDRKWTEVCGEEQWTVENHSHHKYPHVCAIAII